MIFFQLSENPVSNIDPLIDKAEGWKEQLIDLLPSLFLALITIIVFYFLAVLIRRFINRWVGRFTHNKSATNVIAIGFFWLIMISGIMIALSFLRLDKAITGFLAGAGIVGVALGFAFQDTAANFISGIIMAFKSSFRIDDLIETNGTLAVVESIDLRSTKLKTIEGTRVIIPNREIFQKKITNYNSFSSRRVDVKCGVAYNSDLDFVERITLDALKGIDIIRTSPSPEFYYTNFGESAINFEVRVWVDFLRLHDFYDAQHLVIKAIKKKFDEEGVTIPFPIRTIDFGNHNPSFFNSNQ